MNAHNDDYASKLDRIYKLVAKGQQLGLERMQAACDAFGNPERAFEVVHVAGTNGKGSVCAFVASMLQAGDKKVGLYTSPHLQQYSERIQIGGVPIEQEQLSEIIDEVFASGFDLTFYEATTLMAFLAFARAGVDFAVLEVGLGGRLDATNVIPPPRIAAITRVAFDHMNVLGNSLREIAIEKAAIIKSGSTVVTGRLHPEAIEAVKARVAEVGANWIALGDPEPFEGAQLAYPRMAMYGTNLAVATTIARQLDLSPEQIAHGIEMTTWPGRNELLHRNGRELTLLDCAHNPDGALTLSHVVDASLVENVGSRKNVALVFGALEAKNWRAMLDRLENVAFTRVFVALPVGESADPNAMAAYVKGTVAPSIEEALKQARGIVGSQGLVIVAGSAYLVGPARAALLGQPLDPPVAM